MAAARRSSDAETGNGGAEIHNLYVYSPATSGTPSEVDAQRATLDVLKYIERAKGMLGQMGIRVIAHKVTPANLEDGKLIKALRQRGASDLPALITTRRAYVGVHRITSLYGRNIAAFMEHSQAGGAGEQGKRSAGRPAGGATGGGGRAAKTSSRNSTRNSSPRTRREPGTTTASGRI